VARERLAATTASRPADAQIDRSDGTLQDPLSWRPGEVCQFDLWEPSAPVAVGHLEQRRGWVVVACLGYSRAGAGALIFSKQTPDLLWGITRCRRAAR
jgi:hypothetical protein